MDKALEVLLEERTIELEVVHGDVAPATSGLIYYLEKGLLARVLIHVPTGPLHHLMINASGSLDLLAGLQAKGNIGSGSVPSAHPKGHFSAIGNEEGRDENAGLRV